MSGAELVAVLSIGANIIAVVDACNKIIDRIQAYRQNVVFQDLALQLPLLVSAIETLRNPEYCKLLDAPTEKALIRVLEGCSRQLRSLETLIRDLTPSSAASKLQKTWKGIRSFGKDTKVREIVGILTEYKSTITLHLSTIHVRGTGKLGVSSNDKKSIFDVPYRRLPHFVGRKDMMERIQMTVNASTMNPSIVVLTGVGGQGKTQVASEFCHRHSTSYKGVFWVDASSRVAASRSYERILRIISKTNVPSDASEYVPLVKTILREWKERWLLVFDNYDDPSSFSDLTSFFPISTAFKNSAILITSRQISTGRLGVHLRLDGMNEEEGLQLLISRSSSCSQSEEEVNLGKTIVKTLGYLPLAIDQAAAYISIRQIPLHIFSEHFEKRKEFILKDTPQSLWEYQKRTLGDSQNGAENLSVLTTWELSFDQISGNDEERQLIKDFLVQAAFFAPSSISDTLFNDSLHREAGHLLPWKSIFCTDGSWDPFKFQDTIVGLVNLSLIQSMEITSDQVRFSLHPLVKDWLQLREPLRRRQMCVSIATTLTGSVLQSKNTESLSFQVRQELLSHIDACVQNVFCYLKDEESLVRDGGFLEGFQTTFATFYGQHDRYNDAERLFRQALELQTARLTKKNITTLSTMNNLAALYLDSRKLVEAEPILKETLYFKEDMLGPEHPRTLNTVNNLGNLLVLQSNFDEAISMFQRTLEGYEKLNGPIHKTVIETINNIGEVAMKRGEFQEAEGLFRQGIERLQMLTDDDEDSLSLYLKSNIALLYKLQTRHQEATTVYLDVVEKRKALLGSKHSSTIQSMCELADVYHALGKNDLAEYWYHEGCASEYRRIQGSFLPRDSGAEAATLHLAFEHLTSLNDHSILGSEKKMAIGASSSSITEVTERIRGVPKVDVLGRNGSSIPEDGINRFGPNISDEPISRSGPRILDDPGIRNLPDTSRSKKHGLMSRSVLEAGQLDRVGRSILQSNKLTSDHMIDRRGRHGWNNPRGRQMNQVTKRSMRDDRAWDPDQPSLKRHNRDSGLMVPAWAASSHANGSANLSTNSDSLESTRNTSRHHPYQNAIDRHGKSFKCSSKSYNSSELTSMDIFPDDICAENPALINCHIPVIDRYGISYRQQTGIPDTFALQNVSTNGSTTTTSPLVSGTSIKRDNTAHYDVNCQGVQRSPNPQSMPCTVPRQGFQMSQSSGSMIYHLNGQGLQVTNGLPVKSKGPATMTKPNDAIVNRAPNTEAGSFDSGDFVRRGIIIYNNLTSDDFEERPAAF